MTEPRPTDSTGEGAKAGSWRVETRTIVDENGATSGHWISDGKNELVTTAHLPELMIAIAELLGVKEFSVTDD